MLAHKIIPALILGISSCKSVKPRSGSTVQEPVKQKQTFESESKKPEALSLKEKNDDPVLSPVQPEPTTPGGPVAGFEIWQINEMVSKIQTGKPVRFKLTPWSRDTSDDGSSGCTLNPGISQVSWTIGSKPAKDIQRHGDCSPFDFGGLFTKAGQIKIKVEVLTHDGETLQQERLLDVIGEVFTPEKPVAPVPAPSPPPSEEKRSEAPFQGRTFIPKSL